MTPEQQLKALAELDGFKIESRTYQYDGELHHYSYITQGDGNQYNNLPSYLTSYDAIIPLVQKQNLNVINIMRTWLVANVVIRLPFFVWLWATPAQLCESLLRATGKWIE